MPSKNWNRVSKPYRYTTNYYRLAARMRTNENIIRNHPILSDVQRSEPSSSTQSSSTAEINVECGIAFTDDDTGKKYGSEDDEFNGNKAQSLEDNLSLLEELRHWALSHKVSIQAAFEELEDLLGEFNICIAIKEKLVKDSGVARESAYDHIVQKLLTKPRARVKNPGGRSDPAYDNISEEVEDLQTYVLQFVNV
ncbi:hypothetical protein JTB14_031743 [Gonioctena quinquepunctata]|nr:hypothetical protein JTB14_031743 [Gonioctena quinquepunctata]